jgi:hypothetical protein
VNKQELDSLEHGSSVDKQMDIATISNEQIIVAVNKPLQDSNEPGSNFGENMDIASPETFHQELPQDKMASRYEKVYSSRAIAEALTTYNDGKNTVKNGERGVRSKKKKTKEKHQKPPDKKATTH